MRSNVFSAMINYKYELMLEEVDVDTGRSSLIKVLCYGAMVLWCSEVLPLLETANQYFLRKGRVDVLNT